jgi:7,8-dihydropterin-6-yl-methyl-4-(beta-D-ribofuranosyl)aminobenzene 5'-phosphate synthase
MAGRGPFYAHPGMYATRAMKQPDGSMRLMEDIPSIEALTAHGAQVINTTEPQSLSDGMFYVSGEIPRVTTFEHGLSGQHRQMEDGGWGPDPLIVDERWVASHVKDKGLIVFTACSHAGLINVLPTCRSMRSSAGSISQMATRKSFLRQLRG